MSKTDLFSSFLRPYISIPLFLLAVSLLVLNITGLYSKGLRNNELYVKQVPFDAGVILTEAQFYNQLDMIFVSDISDSLKVVKTTDLVNKGLSHHWEDVHGDEIREYNLTIPANKNYILFILSYFNFRFEKFEFLNWEKALERGVGLCSEHAIILSEILNERGIKTNMINLVGHVVAMSEADGKKMIADADLNVVIPYSIDIIEKNPNLINKYYLDRGYDAAFVERLSGIYGEENIVYKNAFTYKNILGVFEIMSYWAIWIIPIILLLPLIGTLYSAKSRRASLPI